MANPNIVNVATINGESQAFNLTDTPTTVLIAAISSGKVVKVNRITVANVDGTSAADVTVAIVKAGYTSAANGATISTVTAHIAKTISVPADATLVLLDTPMYMQEGDVLQGGAGAASDLD